MSFLQKKILFDKYCISADFLAYNAFLKLMNNFEKSLIVIDKDNKVFGMLTIGDYKRFFGSNFNIDLLVESKIKIKKFCNQNYYCVYDNKPDKSHHLLVPVVSKKNKLIDFKIKNLPSEKIMIGNLEINQNNCSAIIAEIGVNHDGKIKLAKKLIKNAKSAGANFVKFQHRNLDNTYIRNDFMEMNTEATYKHLKKINFSKNQLRDLFEYARKIEIDPICTPFDLLSLKDIIELKPSAIKIASADLLNFDLIKEASKFRVPIILSTGMHNEIEIINSVNFTRNLTKNFILLHCISTYPAPDESLNLRYISRLKKLTGCLIGYSSHDDGILPSVLASSLGAVIIEKHITWNKNAIGPDHNASLELEDFAKMVSGIKKIDNMLGDSSVEKKISQGEMINRTNLSKSIYAKVDIKKGETIDRKKIIIRSPGVGIEGFKFKDIEGLKINYNLNKNQVFEYKHFDKFKKNFSKELKKDFDFGLPVRFRDLQEINNIFNPSFLEIHFTFNDLSLFQNYKKKINFENLSFKFHAPETFEDNFILDLANLDSIIRKKSKDKILYTIHVANEIYLKSNMKTLPHFIINVGGHSDHNFLNKKIIPKLFENLINSFKDLEFGSLIPLVQSMPPFPWQLGGRRYHNLFVDLLDFKKFNKITNIFGCLDTSHSYLASKFLGTDFYKDIKKYNYLFPYVHLSDAKSPDGEGLQIGSGDIDFAKTHKLLKNKEFIPEIWQGHLNNFNGFYEAINKLEKYYG